MIVLDANYILRFLLEDNEKMFEEAKLIISQQHCLILNEVIAEVVYVLNGVYEMPKTIIAQTLSQFISLENLTMHESKLVLIEALDFYQSKNIDFIDCYLCALRDKYQIKSFDKKLNKCLKAKN
jgi:predicted nucleic-acid-binding protein